LQPILQDAGVDAAEVDAVAQIALIQIGQRGMIADDAVLDALADEEHGGGSAVVGAAGGVGLTRRPNSLKVIISTRSSLPWAFKSAQKAEMPWESCCISGRGAASD
jgi:hypothetical protein